MKTKIFISLLLIAGIFGPVAAQDVAASLDEARTSYSAGDLENARFALQQALNGINQAIGQDILEMMPQQLGNMQKVEGSDDVTGTNIGFAGLFVSRDYRQDSLTFASFEIVSDSPMLGAISSLLSMSVFLASDPNQKRIKVAGYKALLSKSGEEAEDVSYQIQLPFGNSLMTFDTHGIADEKAVTGLMEEIPVAEIIKTAE